MSTTIDKPMPVGFKTWSAEEKIDYVERLWRAILEQHGPDALPVPQWQLDAAHASWVAHQADPAGARSGEESIRVLEERLSAASKG